MNNRTIPALFEQSVKKHGDNVMMWEKVGPKYIGTTYKDIRQSVYRFSAGLSHLGLQKGDRVALMSEGRNAWVISELAILYAGGINVPLSVKIDELSDLKFRISHSECKFIIVSKNHLSKIRDIKNDLPLLEKVIILDKVDKPDADEVYADELLTQGDHFLKTNAPDFKKTWQSINENDYANICYTSGTTADPKGIILTHLNYTANVEQATSVLVVPQDFVSLLILPWDHSFAHTAGVYTLLRNGASMASIQVGQSPMETLRNIPVNIKEIRPHFLLSVPSLAKNFRKNIENGIRAKGPKVEKLFQKALDLAYAYNAEGWNKGKGLNIFKKPLLMIYDKLIFSKIRENFGGRLQFFIGGGALLDLELQRFFYALGIPMLQGYGLSEAAPIISSNSPKRHKLGSSGYILKDMQVKICDDDGNELPIGQKGEIVVKGENVMVGYWKNEKATKETIKNGWLHTGDLGYLDKDNFLYVLGRYKSLLIGNDGEKYSPEGIEEAITETSHYIEQIMLFNNQNPYTVALVVPNKEAVLRHLHSMGLKANSKEGQEAALKLLEKEIEEFAEGGKHGGQFPDRWLPSTMAILGEGFTEQNRFMNSTLKMVRPRITEFYSNRIEFLYTPEGRNICNHQNMNIIGRWE